MRKISYLPYALLIVFLFVLFSLSSSTTQKIRDCSVSCVAPIWANCDGFRFFVASVFSSKKDKIKEKNLKLENTLLNKQIDGVYEWLTFDQRIDEQMERLKTVSTSLDDLYWKEFFRRRSEELKQILEVELQALPAKIIYREPSSWSSSVWINVGEKDNEELGRLIIGKNSPVVVEDSLVGVVEYVGKKESRVRLITDLGLAPSVRAVRGQTQDQMLANVGLDLYERLHSREELFDSQQEKNALLNLLAKLIGKLNEKKVDFYLAKGEIHGASNPLWRSYGQKLKGIGFNYDYADIEGPARDLKEGRPLSKGYDFLSQAIIKNGDLLVTTGLDGVFPSGLKVATVTKVKDLEEGAYAYEIEASPTARDLTNLSMVFVMPPKDFEKN